MDLATTITTKGQVTIPVTIRRELGAKVGDRVSFQLVETPIRGLVIKVIPSDAVSRLGGSLSSAVRETDHKKARREAGKALLKKYNIKL